MFVASRELRRAWRRFSLVGLVVAMVAVLSTLVVGLSNGLVQQGTSGLAALPFTHLAFAPGAQATFSRSNLDAEQLRIWRTHAAEASPIGVSFINATQDGGHGVNVSIALFGVPARSFLVQRADARAALEGPPGIVLSGAFEKKGLRVGDRLQIGASGVVLPVLGFTFAGSYGHVEIGYTSLSTWQKVQYGDDPRGRYSAIALDLRPGTDISAVDRLADTETLTKQASYSGSPGYTAETATMTMIRVFLLVISALIVGAFFTVLAIQRVRQIGVMKAMGATSWYVMRDGLAQIAIVVVVATAAGTLLGAGLIAAMSGSSVPMVFSVGTVVSSGLILAGAGVLGGALTLGRISAASPAAALGIEG